MAELPLHADVKPGLERLTRAGIRLVTLTNGAAESSRDLLERGDAGACVEQFLSVAQAGRWKPAPEPYLYAAERCRVAPAEMMLVAVHPWDIHGAARAGLTAAWINRGGGRYPSSFDAPELTCPELVVLADALVA